MKTIEMKKFTLVRAYFFFHFYTESESAKFVQMKSARLRRFRCEKLQHAIVQ